MIRCSTCCQVIAVFSYLSTEYYQAVMTKGWGWRAREFSCPQSHSTAICMSWGQASQQQYLQAFEKPHILHKGKHWWAAWFERSVKEATLEALNARTVITYLQKFPYVVSLWIWYDSQVYVSSTLNLVFTAVPHNIFRLHWSRSLRTGCTNAGSELTVWLILGIP